MIKTIRNIIVMKTVNMAATSKVVCLISLFIFVSLSLADGHQGSDAVSYDKDTFQNAVGSKKHFVMYFAPWCGHCKQLAPTWNELAKVYNNEDSPVTVAKVDCTAEPALCTEQNVIRYPTLKFFHKNADDYQRYKGNSDLNSLKKFVEEAASQTNSSRCLPLDGDQVLVELKDDTFENAIREGSHFIQFYAPWCGHCKQLAPTWEKLARFFAGSKHVSISNVDCTLSTKLCVDQGFKSYPKLILFKNGDKVEEYKGSRSYEDLKNFVNMNVKEEDPVVDLTSETFEAAIAAGRTFVNFFSPWCEYCKRLAPTWTKLGQANEGKDVTIARVDCTKYKAICDAEFVQRYPTLFMYHKGQRNEFQGQKDQYSLQGFVDKYLEHTEL